LLSAAVLQTRCPGVLAAQQSVVCALLAVMAAALLWQSGMLR